MSCIRSKNTQPELKVRSFLHKHGFRFRLHSKELPGKPDIVLPKYKTLVFVHGCFWHRHPGCKRASLPKTRQDYWIPKLERNVSRFSENCRQLKALGWKVVVIWECETRDNQSLMEILRRKINGKEGI